ncbi:HAD-IA family hydrolase [Tessaracoccus palaemonis]|uniref:HAD-IA family hydrolase n=1 Tax=Tessaracoccus palaemonis TaxID=2829499 RepID=A0ABX8SLE7_9ACTN|nr:HAD-IA family hydrolase [Tessaracoccus palaemonis]QXT64216.1 HAD-IA family hydrolase [Tessaracoccus palaemonis]
MAELPVRACHGRQSRRDTYERFLPAGGDVDTAVAEQERIESLADGIIEVPGAGALLKALNGAPWAVVTSAPRNLARMRIHAAELPQPDVLVSAEDVADEKPDPVGYLIAASRLGADPARCVVFEDAETGILAGCASGASTIIVGGYRPADDDLVTVDDLCAVAVIGHASTGVELAITPAAS